MTHSVKKRGAENFGSPATASPIPDPLGVERKMSVQIASDPAPLKVLIVDDSPDDRAEMRRLLLTGSTQRYQFSESANGADALSACLRAGGSPPDCILLDYHLPDYDALELLLALGGPDSPYCPVVVTGLSSGISGPAILRLGAQDFIGKAWMNPESLARAVENAIERFAINRELREKDRLLSEAQRIARIGSWMYQPGGETIVWSLETYRIYEVLPDTFTPTIASLIGLLHPEDRPAMQAWITACLAGGSPGERVFRRLLPDGSVRYLCGRGELQRDGEGKPIHIAGTVQDVTERKQAELALQDSEERLRLALDAAQMGIFDWDIIHNEITWSPRHRELWGYGPEKSQLRYEDFACRVHPEDLPRVGHELARCRLERTPYACEFRIVRPDGSLHWVAGRGEFSYDDRSQPSRMRGTVVDTTERKQQEEALREHEIVRELYHRLNHIASRVPGVIYQYRLRPDGSSCFPYASDAIRDIYRVTPEDVREDATAVFATIHPEDYAGVVASIQQSAATLQPWQYEYRVRFADGTVRWLHGNAIPNPNKEPDGTIVWYGFIYDVTEIKQAEQALRESENKFAKIFHDSPIGIAISRAADGKFIDANAAFLDIYGYQREEIIGHSSVELGLWANLNHRGHIMQRVLEEGLVANIEVNYQRKSDTAKRSLLASLDTIDVAGEPCVVGFVLDITDRKRAKDYLQASERKFRLSSQRLAQVVWGTNVGTWEWNVPTGDLQLNERWAEIIGYTLDELEPVSIETWARLAHPDDLQRSNALLERCFNREAEAYECEARMRHKHGDWVWVLDRGRVVEWSDDGKPVQMAGTHQDITDRKQAELIIQQKEAFVTSILDSVSNMIAVIDDEGVILAVNECWKEFGRVKGSGPDKPEQNTHVGENYLHICQAATGIAAEGAMDAYHGIRGVLDHAIPHFNLEYSCQAPDRHLWFSIRVTPLGSKGEGAVISHVDITELKRAAEAIRQSESRYRTESTRLQTILATASDGIHILDMQGNIVQFSDSFAAMLGYAHAEIGRLNVADWDTAIPKEQIPDIINGLLYEPARFETKHRRKDGSIIDVEINAKGVKLEGEHYLYASARDITQRKALEQALLESKAEIDDLYEHAPCGYHAIGPDGTYLRINQTELEWTGYGRDEVVGKLKPSDFFTPAGKDLFQETFARLKQDGHVENVEYDFFGKNGNCRHVSFSGSVVTDADGRYVRSRSLLYDITELKNARATLECLMHEQQAMLNNDLVGIVKLKDRRVVWLNQAMEHIFGYPPGEMDGQSSRILFADDAAYQHLGEVAYPVLNSRGVYRTQLEMLRKNGEKLWIDANGARLPGTDDEFMWMMVDISLIKQYQDKIEHIAFHDSLTGLPNRLLIADRLQQALAHAERSGHLLAVCYLDLDGFKPVNDAYGHEAGDRLLIEIARRLQSSIRANDTAGRLGGDEFVLLLTHLGNPEEFSGALQRVMEAINQPVAIDGSHAATVSASIGIALFPQDGTDPDTLLRHADQAMYAAKQSGKNCYSLFDVHQDIALKTEQENLAEIRRALDRHEFVLHYQPKVNMKTGDVMGVEALIRWQHPRQGWLLPAAFLPIVNNHPLGVELGEWVIDAAFAQLAEWHEQQLDLPISVNIEALHLQSDGFAPRLRARFAAHPGVRPNRLELEVLESSALKDLDHAAKIMQACCDIGVHFAIDDFGTGYSSLTYLRRLPVEILKIDQSFIHGMLDDPEDLSIVKGVIGLARSFHRLVVAEGVETVGQSEKLLALGCDQAQGYVIARPMPGAQLPGWVAAWRQTRRGWAGEINPI